MAPTTKRQIAIHADLWLESRMLALRRGITASELVRRLLAREIRDARTARQDAPSAITSTDSQEAPNV